tara:strand:+ start:485 stop:712 length:228 start_codon:yes stop_codon:yes gene_type:complete
MEDEKEKPKVIMLDGKEYDLTTFSEIAMANYTGVLIADQELKHISHQEAMVKTARIAYASTLRENLPPAMDSDTE